MIKKIKPLALTLLFKKAKSPYQEVAELILRVTAGAFMLTHGLGKLLSFSEKAQFFPDPLGIGSALSLSLATFAEFFCSLLLMVGFLTRFSAFSNLSTMLVAGFIFHSADPFSKKELALLYAGIFLYFTIVGGNRYSLDQLLRKWFQ